MVRPRGLVATSSFVSCAAMATRDERLDLEKTTFDMIIEGARSQCSQGHSYRKVQVKIEEELCLKLCRAVDRGGTLFDTHTQSDSHTHTLTPSHYSQSHTHHTHTALARGSQSEGHTAHTLSSRVHITESQYR